MHGCLYDFFRDQGSSIAGLLALMAGGLAYWAGRAQAGATRDAARVQVEATKNAAKAQVDAVRSAAEAQAEAARKTHEKEIETVRKSLAVELRQMTTRAWGAHTSLMNLISLPGVPVTARMVEGAVGMPAPVVYPAVADRISLLGEEAMDLVIVYQGIEIARDAAGQAMRHRAPDNIPPENVALAARAFLLACVCARDLLPKLRTGISYKDQKDGEMIRMISDAERAWTLAQGPLMSQPLKSAEEAG